jgi:5-enolpyruvylshikimate-3-phosphate synthase
MADKNSKELEQIEIIQSKISDALSEIDKIRNSQANFTNPEELEQAERLIVKETDKLACLVTALKIQQAVASEDMKEKSSELVQGLPNKIKSQGVRLVSV